jgi:hypothetical protein
MGRVETLTKHSAAASVMRYTGGAPSLRANSLQLFYNNYPPKLVKRAIMEAIYFLFVPKLPDNFQAITIFLGIFINIFLLLRASIAALAYKLPDER